MQQRDSKSAALLLEVSLRLWSLKWDFVLFFALAYSIGIMAGASNAISQGCTTGCGLAILFLLPVALVIAVIELVRIFKNRVWERPTLYWFLAAASFATAVGYQMAPK